MFRNVEHFSIPVGKDRISATFHRSKIEDQSRAVLFLHGFNSSKSDRFRFSFNLAQELSEVGIASLRIDFRGCGESDGNFTDMSITSQVEDAIAGLKWLKERYEKIGIVGRSLGSGIALAAATQVKVDSLVLVSPVFDGFQWLQIPKKNGVHDIRGIIPGDQFVKEMGQLTVEPFLKQLSETPILHIHAESDEILSAHHRESYLKNSSPNHQFQLIQNADHTYSQAEHRKILSAETRTWFIKTL